MIENQKEDPHIVLQAADGVHVIPMSFIKDVICGQKDITELEGYQVILPEILQNWLNLIEDI